MRTFLLISFVLTTGCAGPAEDGGGDAGGETSGSETVGVAGDGKATAAGEAADDPLRATLMRSEVLADSIEDLLRPVPLMRPGDVAALRQFSNAANVQRARRLGLRVSSDQEIQQAVSAGRLVRLPDSTSHWVVRDLGASQPYVTPSTLELLKRVGQRFQTRLEEMGLPPLRFEVSSVLRTAADQAALRRGNVNAAAGTSAHEFGTTVDIAYSGYAAPSQLPPGLVAEASDASRGELERMARYVIERMAARKSRELKAILGEALREAQSEGEVLVTHERLQPVYHITVARDLVG